MSQTLLRSAPKRNSWIAPAGEHQQRASCRWCPRCTLGVFAAAWPMTNWRGCACGELHTSAQRSQSARAGSRVRAPATGHAAAVWPQRDPAGVAARAAGAGRVGRVRHHAALRGRRGRQCAFPGDAGAGQAGQAWEPYMQNAVARVFQRAPGLRAHGDGPAARGAGRACPSVRKRGARRGQCRDADDGAGYQRARWRPCRPGAEPGCARRNCAACSSILENLRSRAVAGHGRGRVARVSRRYLYNLFAQASTTPADFILSARLERCRDMLCDAAQAARQIGDIAFRYGFPTRRASATRSAAATACRLPSTGAAPSNATGR